MTKKQLLDLLKDLPESAEIRFTTCYGSEPVKAVIAVKEDDSNIKEIIVSDSKETIYSEFLDEDFDSEELSNMLKIIYEEENE